MIDQLDTLVRTTVDVVADRCGVDPDELEDALDEAYSSSQQFRQEIETSVVSIVLLAAAGLKAVMHNRRGNVNNHPDQA